MKEKHNQQRIQMINGLSKCIRSVTETLLNVNFYLPQNHNSPTPFVLIIENACYACKLKNVYLVLVWFFKNSNLLLYNV